MDNKLTNNTDNIDDTNINILSSSNQENPDISEIVEDIIDENKLNIETDDEYKYLKPNKKNRESKKSRAIMLILFLTWGSFGGHRFYSGNRKSALFLLLIGPVWQIALNMVAFFNMELIVLSGFLSLMYTILSLSICALLITDFINIISGTFRDSNGKYIRSWKFKND